MLLIVSGVAFLTTGVLFLARTDEVFEFFRRINERHGLSFQPGLSRGLTRLIGWGFLFLAERSLSVDWGVRGRYAATSRDQCRLGRCTLANTAPAPWLEIVLGIASIIFGVLWAVLIEIGLVRLVFPERGQRLARVLAWVSVLYGVGFALYGVVRALTPLP
jgi:hypothetical protein